MPRTGSTILVVDDELAIRRVLKVCLDSSGYFVHEAISGREALRAVLEIQPDLIILDLGLPDMDGGNVVSKVRESNQCPILILSVRGQESEKAAVLDMGADDYLTNLLGPENYWLVYGPFSAVAAAPAWFARLSVAVLRSILGGAEHCWKARRFG
ncbi:MAG TPA: response regulator [Bryobacteraceae bacterium]|nr:response regulator [Bryobacteraceae bacterium]